MDARKKVLHVLALTCALTILREAGYLKIQSYRAHFRGQHSAEKVLVEEERGGISVVARDETSASNTKDEDVNWGFAFGEPESGGLGDESVELAFGVKDSRFKRALREELSERFGGRPGLRILVLGATLKGPYWTPFLKHGSCSYDLALREGEPWLARDGLSFFKTRRLSGEIDFDVDGFCSVRELERELARKIARQAAAPASDIKN